MGALKIVERSTSTIVTLDEVKQHIRRLDTNEDDELILRYLRAATQYVENWTGLALIDQTWDYYLDSFPATINNINQPILLPRFIVTHRLWLRHNFQIFMWITRIVPGAFT